MRVRFSLQAMFLAVFVVAALLAFFTPVARISRATCARILPGMTEEQAGEIFGVPPGWYDGIGGIRSDAPAEKGDKPTWVGIRGEVVIDQDGSGRVVKASFYSVRILNWSPAAYFWERFTRVKYMGLSVPVRVLFYIGLTALTTFMLGIGVIPAGARNAAAWHGVIGLVLGVTFVASMFSEDFVSSLFVTGLALSGPVHGALIGIAVGMVRDWLALPPVSKTTNIEPAIPVTAT